jgi:hypothetical protein
MSFVNYLFSWSGRIGRLQWWLGGLVQAIIIGMAALLLVEGAGGKNLVLLVLSIPVVLIALWFGIGLSIKRLHDHNKSGFWFFVLHPSRGDDLAAHRMRLAARVRGRQRLRSRSAVSVQCITGHRGPSRPA